MPWYAWFVLGLLVLAGAFWLDASVQSWMLAHQTPRGLLVMHAISRWGDWPLHAAGGLVGAALAYSLGRRDWAVIFAAMVLACALAGVIGPIIKGATGRARPSAKQTIGWIGPTWSQKHHAFPSGHTTSSTAFFSALCLARRKIGIPLLAIPALVATSRLYLNAHYLSDVTFGAMLGFCCAIIVWRVVRQLAFSAEGANQF